jgi:hypothetical protein
MNETETNSQGPKVIYPKLNLASKIFGIFFTLLGGFLWMRGFIKTSDPDALWNEALWGAISYLIGCGSLMLSTLTEKRKNALIYVVVYAVVLILASAAIYFIIDFFLYHFL